LFSRARRFQPKLQMHRFPGKSFSRTLALITTPDCSQSVVDLVEGQLRTLIQDHVVAPYSISTPWLRDLAKLID